MIIPWRVDVPQDRRPFVNWLIIAGIAAVFAFQIKILIEQINQLQTKQVQAKSEQTEQKEDSQEQLSFGKLSEFILDGFGIKGLFGYMWLHGGLLHLLGNLLFLWIFGNAVCAKIGNVFFLPIYIFLGIVAGIVHLCFQGGPVIGASGAINGIVGMYLVFFPDNDITCYFVWVFFFRPIVREFTLSSYWMILFWLAFDILGAVFSRGGGGGVAYFAHLGGFAVGFGIAILMLKAKWVSMEKYERSLLQILAGRKEPVPELYGAHHGMYPYDFEEENTETTAKPEQQSTVQKPPKTETTSSTKLLQPEQEFIRFSCSCGKRVKIPAKYAGKVGKCPQCNNRVIIPMR